MPKAVLISIMNIKSVFSGKISDSLVSILDVKNGQCCGISDTPALELTYNVCEPLQPPLEH